MRTAFFVAAGLLLGAPGWSLDLIHPVFFAGEPIVILASPEVGQPTLTFCGNGFPARWRSYPDGENTRWEGALPSAPLGVWIARANGQCISFLRIPEEWAILEITVAAGVGVQAPGKQVLPTEDGMVVLGPAGTWQLLFTSPGQTKPKHLNLLLPPGERRTEFIGRLGLESSSYVALPGHDILLAAQILSPVDIPSLASALKLPPGWAGEPASCEVCPPQAGEPVPAGALITRAWRVHIPPDAQGTYILKLTLSDPVFVETISIEVSNRLPLEVVVGHWDVDRDTLDLTLAPSISYEQLLWAASLVGREVPYTGRRLMQSELKPLAESWLAARP